MLGASRMMQVAKGAGTLNVGVRTVGAVARAGLE